VGIPLGGHGAAAWLRGAGAPTFGLGLAVGADRGERAGNIDSDYRGEVVVLLVNLGKDPVVVQPGDRVAQMVIAPVIQGAVEEVAELSSSKRARVVWAHRLIRTHRV